MRKDILYIQRGTIRKNKDTNKEGLDAFVKFDYMGSAEFEFGALPKSLRRVRSEKQKFIYWEYNLENGVVVSVLCYKSYINLIMEKLDAILGDYYRFKGYCDFKDAVYNPRPTTSNFWWDIEGDFFFWISDPQLDDKIENAILGN